MKQRQKRIFLASVLITIVGMMLTTIYSQDRSDVTLSQAEKSSKRQVPFEDYPVTDYAAQEPTDLQERTRRRAKSSRHDLPDKTVRSLKGFTLGEDSAPVEMSQPPDHAPVEPAIPADQSDVIVIGEVTGAKAYLSNDKTGVYSEFAVLISEILKNSSPLSLVPSTSIIAERSGGRVRLPNGKIILRGFSHKGMPRVGKRYVAFLKFNGDTQDFSIITGYELRGGRVFPLDGVPKDDYKLPQFAAYEGVEEVTFLQAVRAALAQSSQGKGAKL